MLHRNIKLSTIPPSPSQQHSLTCSNITTPAVCRAKTGFATGHFTAKISSWKGAAGVLPLPPQLREEGLSRQRGISSWTSCVFSAILGGRVPGLQPSSWMPNIWLCTRPCVSSCASQRGAQTFVLGFGEKTVEMQEFRSPLHREGNSRGCSQLGSRTLKWEQ